MAVSGVLAAVDSGAAPTGSLHDVYAALVQAILLLGPLGYFALGWWRGQTPGMRVAGCHLVDAPTGARLSVEQVALRLAGSLLSALPLALGYWWALGDARGRTWHDRLAGTLVVHPDAAAITPVWNGVQWVPMTVAAASTAPGPAALRRPSPPAPERSAWTWTDAVPLLMLFFPVALVGQIAAVEALHAVGIGHNSSPARSLLLEVMAYGGNLVLLGLFIGLRRHQRPGALGLVRPGRWLAAAPAAMLLALVLEAIAVELCTPFLPATPRTQCQDIQSAYGSAVLLALLGTAVVAPICEEILFRGVIFGWLRGRLPLAPAVLVSAALFALAHSGYREWSLLPATFAIGCVLACLYQWSRSLWPGIAVHSGINTLATMVLLVGGAHC